MTSYIIQLSPLQAEILLETAQAFVGNQKLLHLPDQNGEIIALPLTAQALNTLLSYMEEKKLTDKQAVRVESDSVSNSMTRITIHMHDLSFHYDVNLAEFDLL